MKNTFLFIICIFTIAVTRSSTQEECYYWSAKRLLFCFKPDNIKSVEILNSQRYELVRQEDSCHFLCYLISNSGEKLDSWTLKKTNHSKRIDVGASWPESDTMPQFYKATILDIVPYKSRK